MNTCKSEYAHGWKDFAAGQIRQPSDITNDYLAGVKASALAHAAMLKVGVRTPPADKTAHAEQMYYQAVYVAMAGGSDLGPHNLPADVIASTQPHLKVWGLRIEGGTVAAIFG